MQRTVFLYTDKSEEYFPTEKQKTELSCLVACKINESLEDLTKWGYTKKTTSTISTMLLHLLWQLYGGLRSISN